jgi:hypothetical protein
VIRLGAALAAAATQLVAGPFVSIGGVAAGPGSGLWGDGDFGPDKVELGCIPRRRYPLAIVEKNRSGAAVRIVAAEMRLAAPGALRPLAIQVRLMPPLPPPPNRRTLGPPPIVGLRGWSSAPMKPLLVPAGRAVSIQVDFVMGDCAHVRKHQRIAGSDTIRLTYVSSGVTGHQTMRTHAVVVLSPTTPAQAAHYYAHPGAG